MEHSCKCFLQLSFVLFCILLQYSQAFNLFAVLNREIFADFFNHLNFLLPRNVFTTFPGLFCEYFLWKFFTLFLEHCFTFLTWNNNTFKFWNTFARFPWYLFCYYFTLFSCYIFTLFFWYIFTLFCNLCNLFTVLSWYLHRYNKVKHGPQQEQNE